MPLALFQAFSFTKAGLGLKITIDIICAFCNTLSEDSCEVS
jgi:hypothetical protein